MIDEVKKIRNDQKKLAEKLNVASEAAFPVGSIVDYYKGRGWRRVEILEFSKTYSSHNNPCFLVSSHTGKEYREDLDWLLNDEET